MITILVIAICSAGTGITLGLLAAVVIGTRQEPPASELSGKAERPAAAIIRRLLGVYVRRPDQDADGAEREECLAGTATGRADGSS